MFVFIQLHFWLHKHNSPLLHPFYSPQTSESPMLHHKVEMCFYLYKLYGICISFFDLMESPSFFLFGSKLYDLQYRVRMILLLDMMSFQFKDQFAKGNSHFQDQ